MATGGDKWVEVQTGGVEEKGAVRCWVEFKGKGRGRRRDLHGYRNDLPAAITT